MGTTQARPVKVIDFGDDPNRWMTYEDEKGNLIYSVAPAPELSKVWGIPADGVTLRVRFDGESRLRVYEGNKVDLDTSNVQEMSGFRVSFCGVYSKFVWKSKSRRVVAYFSAKETQTILGDAE